MRRRFAVAMGVGLLSAATLAYEVDLIRLFSFRIRYHFAFMVLSVALLGVGASGVIAERWPATVEPAARRAAHAALGFAASAMGAFVVLARLSFDPTRAAVHPLEWSVLFAYDVAFTLPFACGGMALMAVFREFGERELPRLYAADLVGAGVGAAGVVAALSSIGAVRLVFAVALCGVASAGLMKAGLGDRTGANTRNRTTRAWAAVIGGIALAGAICGETMIPLPAGPGKMLPALLRVPSARTALSEWNSLSRVDVIEAPIRIDWTMRSANPHLARADPAQTQILMDGDAATPVLHLSGDPGELDFLDSMVSSAADQAFHPARVLVIGAGGGVDVLAALHSGAQHVDAVEVNPTIVRLMRGALAPLTHGLYQRPDVTLIEAEGRSYLNASAGGYDAIQLSLVDTWAATTQGAFSLVEAHLYTVEAFETYFRRLNANGVLTVTRWLHSPPRESLRLCSISIAALQRSGVESPGRHVVVLVAGRLANVIVKRLPFTATEVQSVLALARQRNFSVAYAPGFPERNAFAALLDAPSPAEFIRRYPYDISASTDEQPYFFQWARWRDSSPMSFTLRSGADGVAGRGIVLFVLIQVALLALALLALPVWVDRRWRRVGAAGARRLGVAGSCYFFFTGVAFMFIELGLIQRLTLFVGAPSTAMAIVLSAMLMAAGLGSALTARLVTSQNALVVLLGSLILIAAAHTLFLPDLLDRSAGLAYPLRIVVGFVSAASLGGLMGIPFPLGVAQVCTDRLQLSWAWAVNGSASALGPVIGTLIAIDLGTTALMIAGCAGYSAVLFLYLRARRS